MVLIHTNFRADLILRSGHRFISRVLILAQHSKTNFRAYFVSRTANFSNSNRPKYFEIWLKRKALDRAYLYCLKENENKIFFEIKNFARINFRVHVFSSQILY